MTNWDGVHQFSGGGSLPSGDTSPGFSGLRVGGLDGGVLGQTFIRSKSDDAACAAIERDGGACSSYPASGFLAVRDSMGNMGLVSPRTVLASSLFVSDDPFLSVRPATLNLGPVENSPLSGLPGAETWQVMSMKSRFETRWIGVRGDYDGNGTNDPGLFDRFNSRFYLRPPSGQQTFQFGPRGLLLWPLVGDWNADGQHTVGVHHLQTNTSWLKNSLTGGVADVTLRQPISTVQDVFDSPLRWHSVSPAETYVIRWETLPTNRDCPFTCEGLSLATSSGCKAGAACLDPQLMSSNLYLYEYDLASKTWRKSLVDRAWGGTRVGFDFLTFKNVQLVAYYGADRFARVAERVQRSGVWTAWRYYLLDTQFGGWDSHNYLTLTVDANHAVHVSGNMHSQPMQYFKGTGPFGSPTQPLTFQKQSLTGYNEGRATYPRFFRGPSGELLFWYRDGGSGDGVWYVNRYDEAMGRWSPLYGTVSVPKPLFDRR